MAVEPRSSRAPPRHVIGCAPGVIGLASRACEEGGGSQFHQKPEDRRQGAEALSYSLASRYSKRAGRRWLAEFPLPRQSPSRAKSSYTRGPGCGCIQPSRRPAFVLHFSYRGFADDRYFPHHTWSPEEPRENAKCVPLRFRWSLFGISIPRSSDSVGSK